MSHSQFCWSHSKRRHLVSLCGLSIMERDHGKVIYFFRIWIGCEEERGERAADSWEEKSSGGGEVKGVGFASSLQGRRDDKASEGQLVGGLERPAWRWFVLTSFGKRQAGQGEIAVGKCLQGTLLFGSLVWTGVSGRPVMRGEAWDGGREMRRQETQLPKACERTRC